MSDDRDLAMEFADKVRAAYLEVYGSGHVNDELETSDPFMLGDVVVAIVAEFADGTDAMLTVRHCSRHAARGLAHQMLVDWTE